jgi:hypothetical protein
MLWGLDRASKTKLLGLPTIQSRDASLETTETPNTKVLRSSIPPSHPQAGLEN